MKISKGVVHTEYGTKTAHKTDVNFVHRSPPSKGGTPWLLREVPKRKGGVSIANFIRLIFQEASFNLTCAEKTLST